MVKTEPIPGLKHEIVDEPVDKSLDDFERYDDPFEDVH